MRRSCISCFRLHWKASLPCKVVYCSHFCIAHMKSHLEDGILPSSPALSSGNEDLSVPRSLSLSCCFSFFFFFFSFFFLFYAWDWHCQSGAHRNTNREVWKKHASLKEKKRCGTCCLYETLFILPQVMICSMSAILWCFVHTQLTLDVANLSPQIGGP